MTGKDFDKLDKWANRGPKGLRSVTIDNYPDFGFPIYARLYFWEDKAAPAEIRATLRINSANKQAIIMGLI